MNFKQQLQDEYTQRGIKELANGLVEMCHGLSFESGWWEGLDPNNGLVQTNKLCLVHSEISEAMEGFREDLMDDHLPHRKMAEVELADAVIRIADLAGAMGYDLGGAIVEKLAYNQNRADHKLENRSDENGKKF